MDAEKELMCLSLHQILALFPEPPVALAAGVLSPRATKVMGAIKTPASDAKKDNYTPTSPVGVSGEYHGTSPSQRKSRDIRSASIAVPTNSSSPTTPHSPPITSQSFSPSTSPQPHSWRTSTLSKGSPTTAPAVTSASPPPAKASSGFSPELLSRGVRGELTPQEQNTLHNALLDLPPSDLTSFLEKAYLEFHMAIGAVATPGADTKKQKSGGIKTLLGKRDHEPNAVSLSKHIIQFGVDDKTKLMLNKEYSDSFTVTAISGRPKFSFLIPPTKTHAITFTPSSSVMKKKGGVKKITVTLIMRTTMKLNQVIVMDVAPDGARYFIIVKASSEKSVFGVEPNDLDLVEDYGLQIPSVLVTMKNYLYENNGLSVEGVFRVTGDNAETMEVKDQLNRGTFAGCKDIACVASLIKLWFRELPTQLLNDLPKNVLLNMPKDPNENETLEVFQTLREPNRSLVAWLMDVLADVAAMESVNKMTPRALAIVVAPNLFSTANGMMNPDENVQLSQKVVTFIHKVLLYRLRQRYNFENNEA